MITTAVVFAVAVAAMIGYLRWRSKDYDANRADLLSLMPPNGVAAGYIDLAQLRSSALLVQLLAWAPQQAPDTDYAQFIAATGFNYERDLDRMVVSIDRAPSGPTVFAIAEGRFDRKKIEEYGNHFGALKTEDGRTLYAVPVSGSAKKAYFTFLRDDRVAWANDSSYFFQQPSGAGTREWKEHFLRLAGTPVFVVLRQDAGAASALAAAPGGLRSPQLATLISQLEWISIAGKPEGTVLRVVIDGEALTENTVRQLRELLNGLVVIAQMGLNDPKTRKQLPSELREGYLDLLNTADVQQLDRGTSKSVRIVFDVTPKLLRGLHAAARSAGQGAAETPAR